MANDGKWLEKKLQVALQELQTNTRSYFHRFPDSRSARGFIAAQPGDFLWLLPGCSAILLEVKSTTKSAPLSKLLDAGQCGRHRLWHRAGHSSAFIYGDAHADYLAWYDGEAIVNGKVAAVKPVWHGSLEAITTMLQVMAFSFRTE